MLGKNSRRYLIISLILIEMISLFLAMKSFLNVSNKNVLSEQNIINNNEFAMFVETDDGYEEYVNDYFPSGYTINIENSKCVDKNSNVLNDVLNISDNAVQINTTTTVFCYLYFDADPETAVDYILENAGSDLWKSTLDGDGYRFIGTDPSNYICFGTEDKNECIENSDLYMYRIIGIFDDEDGNQHLKLIKKEALNTKYAWHSDYSSNINWNVSDLYYGINDNYFKNNPTYSYMQGRGWVNKIIDWKYTSTNTLASENAMYGLTTGKNYYQSTVKETYLHEMNRDSKENTVGKWEYVNSKIGLMYVSDYLLSLGSEVLGYNGSKYSILKTGWMHISNNDSGAPSQYEWTMTRLGAHGSKDTYYSKVINSSGYADRIRVDNTSSIRPVFYLSNDEILSGGTGKIDDPYTLFSDERYQNDIDIQKLVELSSDDLWQSTLEDDGYRFVGTNPDNYICFGTTDTSTCTGDTDKYMYRIIGIFKDSLGKQYLKLIKKEALNTSYAWHSSGADVDWDASDLYNGINGSNFSTNTTYSYMQDTNWTNKIATWDYTATNTLSYENYTSNRVYGLSYYHNTSKTTYLHEMHQNSKISQSCYFYPSSTSNCSVGEWKTVSTKIGLMYVSDYLLSLGNRTLNLNSYENEGVFGLSWIQLDNGDSEAPNVYEWTMTQYGYYDYYRAYFIFPDGGIGAGTFTGKHSVRPVFYLTDDVKLIGEGTSVNPYVLN